MLKMDQLYWPLSVLSRSIHYKNLTGASQHVGLSQPQLSRIIKQLEEEIGISLLDRTSPRHSSWTPEARKLAEIFANSERALSSTLQEFQEDSEQKEIRIGCLEGLSLLAEEYASKVFKGTKVVRVFLNIYDLNQLESKFLSTDLDIIFSSRSPGTKKYDYVKSLGFQVFEKKIEKNSGLNIVSPYEYGQLLRKEKSKKVKEERLLISNSLQIRKSYTKRFGGEASFPSAVKKGDVPRSAVMVVALGQEYLSKKLWDLL